ncbi:hypothetical protein HDU67_005976 [Dinochytrium kinnereticum]|nr:hypothetical protein HDU67_005976 [Dinochytrium kinnereticum]
MFHYDDDSDAEDVPTSDTVRYDVWAQPDEGVQSAPLEDGAGLARPDQVQDDDDDERPQMPPMRRSGSHEAITLIATAARSLTPSDGFPPDPNRNRESRRPLDPETTDVTVTASANLATRSITVASERGAAIPVTIPGGTDMSGGERSSYFDPTFQETMSPLSAGRGALEARAGLAPLVQAPVYEWQADEDVAACGRCEKRFTLFLRRHHCRWCGLIFCDSCSSKRLPLNPNIDSPLGYQRVCDSCHNLLSGPRCPLPHLNRHITSPTSPYPSPSSTFITTPRVSTPATSATATEFLTLPHTAASALSALASSFSGAWAGFASSSSPNPVPAPITTRPLPSSTPQRSASTPSVDGRSLAESIMNECPVCQTQLDELESAEDAEAHVADCLRKVAVGRGVGMVISGNRYIAQTLKENLEGKECVICFNEMEAGERIARLNCLCIYHEACIESWFKRSGNCPVHYK